MTVFWLPRRWMSSFFLKKLFFFFLPKRQISPRLGTKMYNILIWHTRMSQSSVLLFLAIRPVPNFFLLICFPFSRPFPLYYHLPFIFCRWREKVDVNLWVKPGMGPWSFLGIMGHFTIFAPKTGKLVFQFATRSEWRRYPKLTVVCIDLLSILALLTACQEYLVTLKSMTSQVVQRERPPSTFISLLGSQSVNSKSLLSDHRPILKGWPLNSGSTVVAFATFQYNFFYSFQNLSLAFIVQ